MTTGRDDRSGSPRKPFSNLRFDAIGYDSFLAYMQAGLQRCPSVHRQASS